jgi:plasmid stabilization system protein ParE
MSTTKKKKRGSTARDLSPIKRAGVILRGAGRCVWCLCELADDLATVDHLVSVCQGGGGQVWNLVSACRGCNSARSHGWEQAARHLEARGLDPLERLEAALAQAIRTPIDGEAARTLCEDLYPGRLAYLSKTATARGARRRATAKALVAAPAPARLALPPPPERGQCSLF